MFVPGDRVRSKPRNPELDAGRHSRARLGFILMSTDLAAESDFFAMAPDGVAVHITRLKTDDYTTRETLSRHIEYMADAASRLQPDVHILGDAIIGGDMPKSAFAAGSQAKACAMAVRAALTGAEAFPPLFRNTCWSFIAENHAVKVGANYRAGENKITKVENYISTADEDDGRRAATAREAAGWYAATVRDIFGESAS